MNPVLRGFLIILGIVLLVYGLYVFQSILSYVLISAILSFMGAPLVRLFRKIRIRNWQVPSSIAALLTLTAFYLVLFLVVRLFAPLVQDQVDLLSRIDVEQAERNLELALDASEEWLNESTLSDSGRTNREEITAQLQNLVNFGKIGSVFDNIIGLLGNVVVTLFSISFITFFFLKDGYLIERIIFTVTPDKYMEQVKHILIDSNRLLSRYFIGILIQVSIITLVVSVGMQIIGIRHALIIGLLAGLLNLIPYVGPIAAAFIGILLALTSHFSAAEPESSVWTVLGAVAVVYLIAQAVDNLFIQPYVLGNSVSAHPLEIFVVISMAGTIGGITGMIIAIPTYTLLRIVAREFLSKFKVVEGLTRGI